MRWDVDNITVVVSFIGILGSIAIAFLSPIIAIIAPLLDLSKKKPIDVIKES